MANERQQKKRKEEEREEIPSVSTGKLLFLTSIDEIAYFLVEGG